ncbi:hypothetical protein [Conexibacter sp. DBS9H8]|uniref:hypothetical protein n=1 Tax=Conexibacter sp. DBS9H8 TaxID=2937801 RepID=UPI00200C7E5A|nr:hypothetical protein [Conexibacter sp. DBS9H8]
MSLAITEDLRSAVLEESGVEIPAGLSVDQFENWLSEADAATPGLADAISRKMNDVVAFFST